MKINKKILISAILIGFSFYLIIADKKLLAQQTFSSNLKGKILLQVEENGEAWYVYPYDLKRYYLGRPADAFEIMRNLGIGISNNDIKQIPIAEANFEGLDMDNDGLSDKIEDSLGTDKNNSDTDGDGYGDKTEILNNFNPLGSGALPINKDLQKKMSGLILMQIEQNGEAWYVNPNDLKRYYLGRPADAFNIMRELGLGATNNDIAKIEKYEINEKYLTENIVKLFTDLTDGPENKRKYTDPEYSYSFDYPSDWKIKKYENDPYITQITDARSDFIVEQKGVISLRHFTTANDTIAKAFRVATKGDSTTLSDEEKTINNKNAYENSYNHRLAYEKTTTLEISPKEFIQITLTTTKSNNNDYYNKIYDDLLNSLASGD